MRGSKTHQKALNVLKKLETMLEMRSHWLMFLSHLRVIKSLLTSTASEKESWSVQEILIPVWTIRWIQRTSVTTDVRCCDLNPRRNGQGFITWEDRGITAICTIIQDSKMMSAEELGKADDICSLQIASWETYKALKHHYLAGWLKPTKGCNSRNQNHYVKL